jgi:D-3-phosphoglycerate dehydrogenase
METHLTHELKTVLATNPLHPQAVEILEDKVRLLTSPDTTFETLRKLSKDVDGIIVRAQLPDDICDYAPKLRGIVRHGVGLDFIPVESATKSGVAVANLPGCNTQTVAEYCFSQLFNLRRPLFKADEVFRKNGWDKARSIASEFVEIRGSTLGIVGVGTIGTRIASIALALGIRVLGCSRSNKVMPVGVQSVSLDDLFSCADAVILSCALTPETRGLVDDRLIRLMKRSAVLINAARGPVLDTLALLDALHQGRIAGAALDVFDIHPIVPNHALFRCPNLLLTPHIAAITESSSRVMGVGAANEMLRILAGEAPENLVNPDYLVYRNNK